MKLILFKFITLVLLSCQTKQVSDISIISPAIVNLDLAKPGGFPVKKVLYGGNTNDFKTKALSTGIDDKVLPGRITDLRAGLWVPQQGAKPPYPLLIFLHGNHSTCGSITGGRVIESNNLFSMAGRCNAGDQEILSYLGFEYLAEHMASHGYIVVSINANRGINGWDLASGTDQFLVEARGRLVLKHLAWLKQWHEGTRDSQADLGIDLKGKLDFDHVGFMGHSRGGEGVRAAISLIQDPSTYGKEIGRIKVEGVFEFAPVDLYGSRPFNAPGVNWNVLIGSCDRDISDFQGTGTFRRRRLMGDQQSWSSIVVLPGANHNFFNSKWEETDAETCDAQVNPLFEREATESLPQQQAALMTLSAFFRGFVGHDQNALNFRRVFDPQFTPPKSLLKVARESFQVKSDDLKTMNLVAPTSSHVTKFTEQFGPDRLGPVDLGLPRRQVFVLKNSETQSQVSFEITGWSKPLDLRSRGMVSFAFGSYQKCILRGTKKTCTPLDTYDVEISLTLADGHQSQPIRLRDYITLNESLNEHLTIETCPEPFTLDLDSRQCRLAGVSDQNICSNLGGSWSNDICFLPIYEGFIHALIFQEAPIELKDFHADLAQVKGFRITYQSSQRTRLLLDQLISLRPGP